MERMRGGERRGDGREVPPGSFISLTFIEVFPHQRDAFLREAGRIFAVAQRVQGILHSSFHVDGAQRNEFFTMTVWRSREDMERFRDSSPHAEAMARVAFYGSNSRFANLADRTVLPDWQEVKAILTQEGKTPQPRT